MPRNAHMIVAWEEKLRLTQFHTVKRISVSLDAADAHKLGGKDEDTDLMLSKVQLESIAEAAGFQILESLPLTDTPERVVWQVRGVVEGTDGKPKPVIKTYELDMRLKEVDSVDGGYILLARSRVRKKEDLIKRYSEDRHKPWMPALNDQEGWDKWVNDQAMEDWVMTNRHRISRAETGASLRAIRAKCRIKNTYKPIDFNKPWEIYRAEFDVGRALEAGGAIGEMALRGVGAAMSRALGMPTKAIAGLLEGIEPTANGSVVEQDLLNATEEEINELEEIMVEAGFKNRANCDSRVMDIFDLPLSQLTNRHVALMLEYIELGKVALENIPKEAMGDFTRHMYDVMPIAYAKGSSVEAVISQDWWDAAHGLPEEEEETEKEEAAEEESGEGSEEEKSEEEEVEDTEEESAEETEEEESAEERSK